MILSFPVGDFICNQKRGGTTLRSNAYRLLVSREQAPRVQYPINITYNSIVVRPPSEKLAALTKKRSLRSLSKNYAARSNICIRPMVILFLGAKRFFVRDEIPFFWKQPVLALAKHQVATDLGRLEACLRTDTKMETQDRKSHEADAGCAFLVTINISKITWDV